jgi:hypothetical protein
MRRGAVGGEDHRARAAMAVVDPVEEHVGRIGVVGQVAALRSRMVSAWRRILTTIWRQETVRIVSTDNCSGA